MPQRISNQFFSENDAVTVAQNLLGKELIRRFQNGKTIRLKITETEAYLGSEDLACHASKGRTARTEILYDEGGKIYVYLIYGLYWMLNVVTGGPNDPQAVLIRGLETCTGPGRLGKLLQLDKSFYGENLETSSRIWINEAPTVERFQTTPRIGIDYAGEIWKKKLWRFLYNPKN